MRSERAMLRGVLLSNENGLAVADRVERGISAELLARLADENDGASEAIATGERGSDLDELIAVAQRGRGAERGAHDSENDPSDP